MGFLLGFIFLAHAQSIPAFFLSTTTIPSNNNTSTLFSNSSSEPITITSISLGGDFNTLGTVGSITDIRIGSASTTLLVKTFLQTGTAQPSFFMVDSPYFVSTSSIFIEEDNNGSPTPVQTVSRLFVAVTYASGTAGFSNLNFIQTANGATSTIIANTSSSPVYVASYDARIDYAIGILLFLSALALVDLVRRMFSKIS